MAFCRHSLSPKGFSQARQTGPVSPHAPHQFLLKPLWFPGRRKGGETVLPEKMGFSAAKPPGYTPQGMMKARKGFSLPAL